MHVCSIAPRMLMACLCAAAAAASDGRLPLAGFITRSGDRVMERGAEFRFVGTNMPDVLQIISRTAFAEEFRAGRYRLPDDYEIRDAVRTEKQLGGRVMRAFVITCRDHPDANFMFDVSSLPVKPNEAALRVVDRLLQICNEEGVRVYLPLVAASSAIRGDVGTYGKDFWLVGSPANLRFKDMVSQFLNRTNAYTGLKYKDDPAVFAWESGNELVLGDDPVRRKWLHDMAAYVKAIDSHHLYMDGRNDPQDVYGKYEEFMDDPNIDLLSYHTYRNLPGQESPVQTLRTITAYLQGRKPLVVGEIAMHTPPAVLRELLAELAASRAVGANFWAQRFHNRDGGFYRHADTGSMFEDLNWPGFAARVGNLAPELGTEKLLQDILAEAAWHLQGVERPPLPSPDAPLLLPIRDVGHIAWRGATGATGYDIERAPTPAGPWVVVGRDVPDNVVVANPAFADAAARTGEAWCYRVRAKNASGESGPSNVVGPVAVDGRWLIDELFDLGQLDQLSQNVKTKTPYARDAYLEDRSLLAPASAARPAWAVYHVDGVIDFVLVNVHRCRVDPVFSGSVDGRAFFPLEVAVASFDGGMRKQCSIRPHAGGFHFLKIALDGATSPDEAIGRVEIEYAVGGTAGKAN